MGSVVGYGSMRIIIVLLLWALLLAVCWPLALLFVLLWPVLFVLSIPFRIVGVVLEAVLALLKAILFLPARVLGWRA